MLLGVLLSEAGVVGAQEEGDGGDAVLIGQGIVQDVINDHLCGRRKLLFDDCLDQLSATLCANRNIGL